MADQPAETVTATIRRLEAQVAANNSTSTTTTPNTTEATPTPLEVAQATGAVTAREAGTFVLVDGLPALLVEHRDLIDLGDGVSLDVWTVTRFTRQGPDTIDRHGFLDGAA